MTIGAMRALRDAGLSVPGDLALVAFDDFEWSDLFSPRLTAVAQPEREMASTAVSLLLDRMAEPESETRQIRLSPTINHRDSCGCRQTPACPSDPSRQRSVRAASAITRSCSATTKVFARNHNAVSCALKLADDRCAAAYAAASIVAPPRNIGLENGPAKMSS